MQKTNIALIGASGCGKTSVGQYLSELCSKAFTDTDAMIEADAGIPISEIFAKFGEPHFREFEAAAIKKAAAFNDTVIATGGGCVLNPENLQTLKQTCIIVYIECTPKKILSNIKDDTTRPLMQADNKLERITQLLNARKSLYEKYADITVNAATLNIDETAREVYNNLKCI